MINYFLYRIGQFLALHLPLSASYGLAILISSVREIFAYQDRRAVRENLRVIFPDKPEKEIRRIQRRMFDNFAKYLVDFFRFPIMDAEYIKQNIRFENLRYFNEVFAKGKGVIAVTAHLGNWELAGVAVAFLGHPVWAVALPHKSKKINDFFNFQREAKGMKVIPLGKAVRECLNQLNKNQLVALVGDRDFTETGRVVEFFGKPSLFPVGAAAFHLKTGAGIVPAFMLRDENGGFTLKVEKPISFVPSGDKDKDTLDLINKYKAVIEDYIRKYPDQWFMFRRFWIT